jgi:hypothetical protein
MTGKAGIDPRILKVRRVGELGKKDVKKIRCIHAFRSRRRAGDRSPISRLQLAEDIAPAYPAYDLVQRRRAGSHENGRGALSPQHRHRETRNRGAASRNRQNRLLNGRRTRGVGQACAGRHSRQVAADRSRQKQIRCPDLPPGSPAGPAGP